MKSVTKKLVLDGHAARMGPYNLSVWIAIGIFISQRNSCPTHRQIASATGIGLARIKTSITELCNLGYLIKQGGGAGEPNHYQLIDPRTVCSTNLTPVNTTIYSHDTGFSYP